MQNKAQIVDKTILGSKWSIQPWTGRHGCRMKARIVGLLEGVDINLDSKAGLKTLTSLLGNLDEDTYERLVFDLLRGTTIDGKDATDEYFFDTHFSANYGELLTGLALILKVNLGHLFTGASPSGSQGWLAEMVKVLGLSPDALEAMSSLSGRSID